MTPLSPFATGFKNRCPQCGEGKLFEGFLTLKPHCSACKLDYTFEDAGDGPAVFIILFVGMLFVGLVLFLELKYSPPFWVQAVLWPPLILLTSLSLLRPLKGLMIAQQFVRSAHEGKIDG
jgi:uncharacterized protein (DUF983 family)